MLWQFLLQSVRGIEQLFTSAVNQVETVCIGYRDLTLLSLLTAPAAMLTVSVRDYVDRPTHEFGAELDGRGFP